MMEGVCEHLWGHTKCMDKAFGELVNCHCGLAGTGWYWLVLAGTCWSTGWVLAGYWLVLAGEYWGVLLNTAEFCCVLVCTGDTVVYW